jgi:alginate O-acetyltransferase complex protein AlgI
MTISPYTGLAFWSLLALFVVVHSSFSYLRRTPWLRNAFMIIFSYLIIFFSQDGMAAGAISLALIIITLLVYISGKSLLRASNSNRRALLAACVTALVILVLCSFKYDNFQVLLVSSIQRIYYSAREAPLAHSHLYFLGVSYFSFKLIHFIVDCFNHKVRRLDLLTFANYICFFPGFFAGPINRYGSFAEDIHNPEEVRSLACCSASAKRIINGLFKKTLAGILQPFTIVALDLGQSHPHSTLALSVYAYMFFIYFDFSGYSDLAIGTARAVGINLPENFNNPFLKRNLQQFWANWHISLTTWLTDYVYWPLARKIRHVESLAKNPVTTSNICIILTFIVCGLWHGEGFNFFLWGVYHGVGLAGLNIYNQLINRYTSRGIKRFANTSPIAHGIGTFITFQYVAFGFILFACDIDRIRLLFNAVLS